MVRVKPPSRRRAVPASDSAFAGFRFPAEVIVLAVRWYLRYGPSYRDIEELRYVYRAVDQDGQVIDVLVSVRRDADAARRFFRRVLTTLKVMPVEVVTDAAAVYPRVLDEVVPAAWHHVERWANNRIEADHGRLKHRLRPMRGLRTDPTATVIISGLAFLQNLRRGRYEIAIDVAAPLRVAAAFTELAQAI
jgi:transposase-like protein